MTVPGNLVSLFSDVSREGTHTFDAVSTYNGAGASDQFTHTCGAGTTVLVLCVTVGAADVTGTHVNYNGVAMTEVASSPQDISETVSRLFYMIDPPTGSAYTVDFDNPATSRTFAASASSYISSTGKTALDGDTGSAADPDTDPTSDSITPTKDGCVIVQCSGTGDSTTMTGNRTLLFKHDFGLRIGGHQYALQNGAGLITFTWNTTIAEDGTHVLAAFKPA